MIPQLSDAILGYFAFEMIDTIPFIQSLRQRLAAPLPGRPAQFKMAFAHRVEELKNRLNPPDNAKIACVLISLWEENGTWRTALIRRTENPRDRHSGQISFPGGRYDEGDGSFAYTALREAKEEIGIRPEEVEVLGEMTDLYIPVSNFVVRPFVGLLQTPPSFQLQPGEVEQVFSPALGYFQDLGSRAIADVKVGGQLLVREVPCFMIEDRPVWGATAMILSEFLELID
ncbi:MAG: NUDIX hydrolase [Saprospiraceae bacterium]